MNQALCLHLMGVAVFSSQCRRIDWSPLEVLNLHT